MFGILAVIAFVIAAILCFIATSVSSADVTGIIAIGLALLAVHLIWPWRPWNAPPP